jgi:alkanesulfonate monooxygenase SsuD/methylene tetrahydromethanopterin reductase-like flavin-dependent oxidoreductase (luciferase family)
LGLDRSTRAARLEEGLEVVRRLWTEPEVTFEGRFTRLEGARREPKPVQRPHPPLTIGGNGPTRTLRAVARWAQQWNSMSRTVDDWKAHHEVLLQRCVEEGRDPAEVLCSVNLRAADLEPVALADRAAEYGAAGVGLVVVLLAQPFRAADLEGIADALRPLTERVAA